MRELNDIEIEVVNGGMSQYDWESYAAAAAEYYRNYFANHMPWGSSGGGLGGNLTM